MDLDELAELMAEPPGGENFGYVKGEGEWLPLGIPRAPDDKALSGPKLAPPRKHGSSYTYVKIRCRCALCRAWKSAYDRERRMRNPK